MGDPNLPDGTSQRDIDEYFDDGYRGDCPDCESGDLYIDSRYSEAAVCDVCGYSMRIFVDKEPEEPDEVDNTGYGYEPPK